MSTLTITPEHREARQLMVGFAEFVGTPVEIREALTDALRDTLPAGMDDEQVGWTLAAVSTALMMLAKCAMTLDGNPSAIVSPRLLAVLCSTAEGFITESELPSLED